MPFTSINQIFASDLILSEEEGFQGREVVTLNWTAGGSLKFGTVLFRAKSIDPTAAWAPALATANIAIGNEYAVYVGDCYDVKTNDLTVAAATNTPVLTIRRSAELDDTLLRANHISGGFTSAAFNQMVEALKLQGVIVRASLTAITA